MKGKADDLGGGVFKKRLNKNMHRSIILREVERTGCLPTLFAKSVRELAIKELVEICHEQNA